MQNSLVKQSSNIVDSKSQFGGNSVIESREMTTAMAEVQAKVIMAKQFPRDLTNVMDKVKAACGRIKLAEQAEYEYPRGGTKVTGPTVKLLETVAQCYGNLDYGWHCESRDLENHVSHCKAVAWDIENNISTHLDFEVEHKRNKRGGDEVLNDVRDISELEANYAARKYRKCLEQIVPRDIVDQAVEWCKETLTKGVDIQAGIDGGIKYLREKYGVKPKQIEKYFGMSRAGFSDYQYISLKKIAASLRDGMKAVEDIFPPLEEDEKQTLIPEQEQPKQEEKVEQPKPAKQHDTLDNLFA